MTRLNVLVLCVCSLAAVAVTVRARGAELERGVGVLGTRRSRSRTPIIISTDPGVDDSIALLLAVASSAVELKAVCIDFGSLTNMTQLSDNALAVLALAGMSPSLALASLCCFLASSSLCSAGARKEQRPSAFRTGSVAAVYTLQITNVCKVEEHGY